MWYASTVLIMQTTRTHSIASSRSHTGRCCSLSPVWKKVGIDFRCYYQSCTFAGRHQNSPSPPWLACTSNGMALNWQKPFSMMNKRNEPEGKTKQWPTKFAVARLLLACAVAISAASFASAAAVQSQKPLPPLDPATNPHRTRLILKDGSYQIIMSYRVVGNVVRYVSAERGGAEEEIPADLVDFEATRRWEKQHSAPATADGESGSSADARDRPRTTQGRGRPRSPDAGGRKRPAPS